jgi:glycosyltransferase involved in cell wall biosynthesis
MLNVVYFFRKQLQGAQSVERIFGDISSRLPSEISHSKFFCKYASSGFFRRLFNLIDSAFNQSDVNHVTGEVHFLTYFMRKDSVILTILDCYMMERLTGFKRWIFWLFWLWLPEKRAKYITVISECTKQQLLSYIRCDPNKIKVIPCPLSPEFRKSPKIFNKCPRILQVGTFENKNLNRVIQAIRDIDCKLIIIGHLSKTFIDNLNNNNIIYENYTNLSREDLIKQYIASDILIFASTYEGFGLPIIEANAIGRAVVCSNIWSMPEVAGDAACLIDPYDVNSIKFGLIKVINDANYRNKIIEKGYSNVKRFDLELVALQYADLYKKIFNN